MSTSAAVVIDVDLDQETIEDIRSLRLARISHYKNLISNLSKTKIALSKSDASLASISDTELKSELESTLMLYESRLSDSVIYEDELLMYCSVLEG